MAHRAFLLLLIAFVPHAAAEESPGTVEAPAQHSTTLGLASDADKHALGRGVKVAILDSGFRGYRTQLGRTLPRSVTTASFRRDGDLEAKASIHGILCAEVVHAIAPAAELLFANWEPDHPEAFLKAVAWARSQGVRVISCSIIMPGWSDGRGNGSIATELRRLLGSGSQLGEPLFVAAVGNVAERHWVGEVNRDRNGLHRWRDGRTQNPIIPWQAGPISIEFTTSTASTVRPVVTDAAGRIVSWTVRLPVAGLRAEGVRFIAEVGGRYFLRLENCSPGDCCRLTALGAYLGESEVLGSVSFPADGDSVLAVTGVTTDGKRPAYCSCGAATSAKPDCSALIPFACPGRDEPFGGTSAAAPQAAALAAILAAREPNRTAAQIRRALCEACRDLGPPGWDPETGHGLLTLPKPTRDIR